MAETWLQRAQGRVELGFGMREGACRLLVHQERGCAKARFPKPIQGAVPEAVLLNTAGGLTDGDRIEQKIVVGTDGSLVVTTQAAEKVYRARSTQAFVRTRLELQSRATLFWLPQETILFEAGRLDRSLEVDLQTDSVLIAVESLVLGRAARGEAVSKGCLDDRRSIRVAGRLAFADRFRLDGDLDDRRNASSLLGGASAMATMLVFGASQGLMADLRNIDAGSEVRVGISFRDPVLVVRLLGSDAMALRASLIGLLEVVLDHFLPGCSLPRVWLC